MTRTVMRTLAILFCLLLLTACSAENAEEFVFRKNLEYQLVKLCDDEEACITAVKTQTKACMESSNWRDFLNNQDDTAELNRFTVAFYGCLLDPEGLPYFEVH